MGFLGLLTIVFVVLKLIGIIGWSWWLVFSPLIAMSVLYVMGIFVFGLIFGTSVRKFNKVFRK